MKCAAAIFLLGSGAANAQADNDLASDPAFPQFQAFIEEHRGGASYSTEVETIGRFNAFKSNLKLAEERNRRGALSSKLGQPQETHGVTKFMDLTPQEFNAQYKGLIPMKDKESIPVMMHANAADVKANAKSIDWNSKGVLTKVKNQGHCGSCWAFSATEQLESQYKQKYGTLKELAPQQITSCDKNDGGCQGGNPINAWRYVSGFGGQELEQNYPYTSGTTGQTGSCKSNKADVSEDTTGQYTMIARSAGQESNMLAQIQKSPMSICVDATLWQTYKGGVITSSSGCGTSIDHAVQATGYNAAGNYWIIRNSWGTNWGEKGFVWVEYGHNVCGVTDQATLVNVEKLMGMEEKVHV
jgi:C1A family cysteine protease